MTRTVWTAASAQVALAICLGISQQGVTASNDYNVLHEVFGPPTALVPDRDEAKVVFPDRYDAVLNKLSDKAEQSINIKIYDDNAVSEKKVDLKVDHKSNLAKWFGSIKTLRESLKDCAEGSFEQKLVRWLDREVAEKIAKGIIEGAAFDQLDFAGRIKALREISEQVNVSFKNSDSRIKTALEEAVSSLVHTGETFFGKIEDSKVYESSIPFYVSEASVIKDAVKKTKAQRDELCGAAVAKDSAAAEPTQAGNADDKKAFVDALLRFFSQPAPVEHTDSESSEADTDKVVEDDKKPETSPTITPVEVEDPPAPPAPPVVEAPKPTQPPVVVDTSSLNSMLASLSEKFNQMGDKLNENQKRQDELEGAFEAVQKAAELARERRSEKASRDNDDRGLADIMRQADRSGAAPAAPAQAPQAAMPSMMPQVLPQQQPLPQPDEDMFGGPMTQPPFFTPPVASPAIGTMSQQVIPTAEERAPRFEESSTAPTSSTSVAELMALMRGSGSTPGQTEVSRIQDILAAARAGLLNGTLGGTGAPVMQQVPIQSQMGLGGGVRTLPNARRSSLGAALPIGARGPLPAALQARGLRR